jgi:hypothetical protein
MWWPAIAALEGNMEGICRGVMQDTMASETLKKNAKIQYSY